MSIYALINQITLVVAVSLQCACGHSLTIDTIPSAANVYLTDLNGSRKELLGKTPLQLKQPKDGSSKYSLEIDKPGFRPYFVFFEQVHAFGSASTMDITLFEEDEIQFKNAFGGRFSTESSQMLNEFVELKTNISSYKINPSAQSEKKVKALEKKMKSKYETFSSFNALMGDFYLHSKKQALASKYLKRALELNPQDVESKVLLERITKPSKKGRAGASGRKSGRK